MDDVQRISDSAVLATMAHPLRRRLLAVLAVDGPLTVGLLAERTDQAVGNVSHHLRRLADAGLVAEVPELARDRRERWWRRTARSLSWSPEDFAEDPAGQTIAQAAESINVEYLMRVMREWAEAGDELKGSWPSGPFASDVWMHLTDAELAELGGELTALLHRWADRGRNGPVAAVGSGAPSTDGASRRPVLVFARGVPGRP